MDTLIAPLHEFLFSPSGAVIPRQGLSLGGVVSVLAGLAVLMGTASKADADYCYGIPENQGGWVCNGAQCQTEPSILYYERYYFHYPDGQGGCTYLYQYCGSPC